MPAELIVDEVFKVLLLFARLGATVMLMPGFGEHHILPRARLLLGLGISLLLAPVLAGGLPPMPAEPLALAVLLGREVVVGLFLGAVARLALAAIHVGGSLVAMQSNLSAAAMFDPSEATQGTVPGAFLSTAALAVLFAADLHHLLLRGLAASYATLPVGGAIDWAAVGELMTRLAGNAIAVGARIAGPLILAGFLVNLGLGALGRMVPSLPIFFVALPLQLLLALVILELSLPAIASLFGDALVHGVAWLDRGG